MTLPGNGIFVVKGEISILMTAMRRGTKWSSHLYQDEETDSLMKSFQDLKDALNKIDDLKLIEPQAYLNPFLSIIKAEETSGTVTSLALSSVNKFLSYGLISGLLETNPSVVSTIVHNIADAVNHARFIGSDQSSDGAVLMKILQVLRTLTVSPEGYFLTNNTICEIMLSCFKISFETRLNELLRRTAEHYLKDMVQLVFKRLPQFSDNLQNFSAQQQFKMRPGTFEPRIKRRSRSFRLKHKDKSQQENKTSSDEVAPILTPTTPVEENKPLLSNASENIVDMQGIISHSSDQNSLEDIESQSTIEQTENGIVPPPLDIPETSHDNPEPLATKGDIVLEKEAMTLDLPESELPSPTSDEFVNQRGIRFTSTSDEQVLTPYGLGCVKELFTFLISLCNPLEKQNTDIMIHLGLTLLTVAFEVGCDSIGKYNSLLDLVKDDLCRNIFSLLTTDRIAVFASDLQVSFLMFESLRTHLKFQLEHYLLKLVEIIQSDNVKITYEHKELALDNILQLWRIPGFVSELYVNYDCDMYCSNLYEELTELFAKYAFSAKTGVYHTHLLSLDALLTVVDLIVCHSNGNGVDKSSRLRVSQDLPPKHFVVQRKSLKKWLPMGTKHFNDKPKKGIQFLQEHGILKPEMDPYEIAIFLKENPALDKAVIGEFISNRNNLNILDAFVKTFEFHDMRIDEALRHYLESFRLPGEAPTIAILMEHFAEHWHKSNGEPFVDVDSAFTLAYAIIMLNVDQHNLNAKKQKTPMTASGFKKNVKGVNGGGDFDQDMLDEIYHAIKTEEIVMPAEQTGLVRENYLWKVLLRKGASKDGTYHHSDTGEYDQELFSLIWNPVITALTFVFERTEDANVAKKALKGFESCASISSHFNMTPNLDNLVLTLAKFTSMYKTPRQANSCVNFGGNKKAKLALKTVFHVIHRYGDSIREGWKHLLEIILSLYANNLLPKTYIECEDFIETSGKINLLYEEPPNLQKQDTSLFGTLYSYMVSSENLSKIPSVGEQEYIDSAKNCIRDCNLEQLVTDSKFLNEEALFELIKTLVDLSRGPDSQKSLECVYNESVTVFFLELLIRIVIQNRDRVMTIWQQVRDHLYTLVINASYFDYQFLLERSVIGLLRVAIRLMRNEDMSPVVLQSLRMLLLLKSTTLCRISRQISFGLYELLKTSAQNIHTNVDWTIIFTLLECVGAGAMPPKPVDDNQVEQATKSDNEDRTQSDEEPSSTDRGYASDSEVSKTPKLSPARSQSPPNLPSSSPQGGGWILVGTEEDNHPVMGRTLPPNQYGLALGHNLGPHDPSSLIKCCESLAFLVRDVAHITPYNFDVCVHCIRTFVEASLHGSKKINKGPGRPRRKQIRKHPDNYIKRSPQTSPEESSSDEENIPTGYQQISIQLLDLMHTLHTRTAQIFKWWAEESGNTHPEISLWTHGWCPLLQGIARLCCDIRKQVRMNAITYLQRALLVHDLQTLNGPEWEACFQRVLFPLLEYLLQPINPRDPPAMEETRIRAATLLSKVFLHHLTPLLTLPTFFNLWLTILNFMDRYMHAEKSDLLYEAIPESLKNMLLVMDSAKVFETQEGNKNQLWHITWDRIGKFLPHMKEELFREMHPEVAHSEKQEINDEAVQKTVQHNVENATRSSIILQPPSAQQSVSSPLFAHLGQMVSTPIGSTLTTELPSNTIRPFQNHPTLTIPPPAPIPIPVIPNSTAPILQTGFMPPNQPHTFPVLYSAVPKTTEVQPQPVSIYSEYISNPYNFEAPNDPEYAVEAPPTSAYVTGVEEEGAMTLNNGATADINNVGTPERSVNQIVDDNVQVLNVNNNAGVQQNFFQSSNYFSTNVIPPGSEILFQGQNQQKIVPVTPVCAASDINDV